MKPLFPVGNHQIDRREVNPDLIKTMADSARGIKLEGNPSAKEWDALADRVAKNDALSNEDLKLIQDLGKKVFSHHRQLHKDLKAANYRDKAIRAELQDVHVFQHGSDTIKEALTMAGARAAVQAVAGASFGPIGTVAAYAAYAKLQEDALKPLVENIEGLRDGSSASLFTGNKTQAFHGEEIWKQMVTMLDAGVESAKAGKPVEVNAQYYELTNQQIVGKLAENAEAGNKVRVNVDLGRLVAFRGDRVEIDEVPDKLRALLQLSEAKGDVGVSAYPVTKQLGDSGDLMHRKGLRVGDQFLLSGMNANEGSGENIDAGYLIEGPAAKRLVENFKRDVKDSTGATKEEIYGEKPLAEFMEGDFNMGPRGLIALMDTLHGPKPAGTSLPRASTLKELKEVAQTYGHRVSEFVSCTAEEAEKLLAEGEMLPLSKNGKEKFLEVMDRALGVANSKENVKRLKDIGVPKGDPKGTTAVALADLPTEREALMLTAITGAEKFIYVPAFVMTKGVAMMLIAKRDEMREQGKEIDIRVLADPGVYPDGGTPNSMGVELLENAGIPARWALLPRSGWHDRKIHAKELLTDKGEFYGSTNFSNKGLRENWEHSGYTVFDEKDPSSIEQRESAKASFLNMWDNQSFDLNSIERARKLRDRGKDDKDFHVQVDEARFGVFKDTIQAIEKVEKDSALWVEGQATDPKTAGRIVELQAEGYDEGSATLIAVREKVGPEAFQAAMEALPSRRELDALK